MAKAYSWDSTNNYLYCSGGTMSDPMTFNDIYEYFKANPMTPAEWDMPRSYGGSPYELCENNASEWAGLNGLGTPSNDNTVYTKNSYSVKATYSSAYSTYTGLTINLLSGIYVQVSGSSMNTKFAVGDEVHISNSTAYNNIILKVAVVTSTYIYCVAPEPVGLSVNLGPTAGTETNVTATKYHALSWNQGFSHGSFYASHANKFRFSVKTDAAGSVKIKGIVIRNYYGRQTPGSGTEGNVGYGAYYNTDIDVTTDWVDHDLEIRDFKFYFSGIGTSGNGYRNYWSFTDRIVFLFDGLATGESVWIDGVRLTNSDRNPQKIGNNAFIFTTPLYVSGGFVDSGFYVQFNLLNCEYGNNLGSTTGYGIRFNASGSNYAVLGDYLTSSFQQKNGGTFYFNHFKLEDTGTFQITSGYTYGIKFLLPKYSFCTPGIYQGTHYWADFNCVREIQGGSFYDCVHTAGRYGIIDGTSTYTRHNVIESGSYAFWIRTSATNPASPLTFKNLRIIKSANNVMYSYDYGFTADVYARLINLDVSGVTVNPLYYQNEAYTAYGINTFWSSSVDLTVIDEAGTAISGATVDFIDKDDNVLQTYTTNASGLVTDQYFDYRKSPALGQANKNRYFDTESDWTNYYPITMKISKAGYETYESVVLSTYSRSNEVVKYGLKQVITLKKSPLAMADTDGGGYAITTPALGSKSGLTKL